jgi:hypothetical protein
MSESKLTFPSKFPSILNSELDVYTIENEVFNTFPVQKFVPQFPILGSKGRIKNLLSLSSVIFDGVTATVTLNGIKTFSKTPKKFVIVLERQDLEKLSLIIEGSRKFLKITNNNDDAQGTTC